MARISGSITPLMQCKDCLAYNGDLPLNFWWLRRGDIRDDESQLESELSFMYLCYLRKAISKLRLGSPSKILNILVECIRAGRLETEAEKFLYFCSQSIKTHAINRILLSEHSFGCANF